MCFFDQFTGEMAEGIDFPDTLLQTELSDTESAIKHCNDAMSKTNANCVAELKKVDTRPKFRADMYSKPPESQPPPSTNTKSETKSAAGIIAIMGPPKNSKPSTPGAQNTTPGKG